MTKEFLFSHARTGLKYGLISLGLGAGDEILIPDYICGVVLHPFEQLGIKARYYSLTVNLEPDWPAIESMPTEKVKAILMVHYFGQPQDVTRFTSYCQKRSWWLIEDNAHGHGGKWQNKMLGTLGDIGIASPRKFYNLISGGVLFINRDTNTLPVISNLPVFPLTFTSRLLRILSRQLPFLKRKLKYKFSKRPICEDPFSFHESPVPDYQVDPLSMKDFVTIDWVQMAAMKRRNYATWEGFCIENGLTPVFNSLYAKAAPQCFPAYARNAEEARQWFEWGWENGYLVYSWPALPVEIIHRQGHALNKWQTLVCFSTEKEYRK